MKMLTIGDVLPLCGAAALAVVLAISLPGCKTLSPATANVATTTVEQLAVEYATGRVVEIGSTTAARQTRAASIRQIAQAVDAVAHGSATSISQLQQLALQKITTLNLQPSDALLATGLVSAIVAELNGKVSAGVLSAGDLVALDDVLGWVETACSAYGG